MTRRTAFFLVYSVTAGSKTVHALINRRSVSSVSKVQLQQGSPNEVLILAQNEELVI